MELVDKDSEDRDLRALDWRRITIHGDDSELQIVLIPNHHVFPSMFMS